MASDLLAIADAVQAYLAGKSDADDFSDTFAPMRQNLPRPTRETITGLTVLIAPGRSEREPLTRSATLKRFSAFVLILAPADAADDTTTDPYFDLAEELEDALEHVAQAGAAWESLERPAAFEPDWLDEENLFAVAIETTYRTQ